MADMFINPFDTIGGYNLVEMTTAINLMPLVPTMMSDLGLFTSQSVTGFTLVIEQKEGVLRLLPTVTRGGPATVATRQLSEMRAFSIPHIPHNDVILPSDVQGIRAFGTTSTLTTIANVMAEKLQMMRDRHSQTLEYMKLRALQGILKDGAGNTLANFYDMFDVTKHTVDLVLGTPTTDVPGILRELLRYFKRNLKGESMTKPVILVSPSLWDKFIKHATVIDAYKYYSVAGGSPLRDDMRPDFTFHGVTFREYDETFTLFGGSTEEAIATDYGIGIPLGTRDTFKTVFGPADLMETVNTPGQELYARQLTRQDGTGIDLLTESNPFPMVRRPALVVEVHTSN